MNYSAKIAVNGEDPTHSLPRFTASSDKAAERVVQAAMKGHPKAHAIITNETTAHSWIKQVELS